jgi:type 1 fimbria pilin
MMNKQAIFAGVLTLGLLLTVSAEEKTRTFTGEIADSQCSMNVHSLTRSHTEMMKNKNMGGTATNCTNYCIKYLGGDYVLAVGDQVYRLDEQEKAAAFAGLKVKITGTLNAKSKTIHVVDMKAAE